MSTGKVNLNTASLHRHRAEEDSHFAISHKKKYRGKEDPDGSPATRLLFFSNELLMVIYDI